MKFPSEPESESGSTGLEIEVWVLLCYKGTVFHKQGNNVRRTLTSMKVGLKISLVFPSNGVVGV